LLVAVVCSDGITILIMNHNETLKYQLTKYIPGIEATVEKLSIFFVVENYHLVSQSLQWCISPKLCIKEEVLSTKLFLTVRQPLEKK
jgi:hypothetical protein